MSAVISYHFFSILWTPPVDDVDRHNFSGRFSRLVGRPVDRSVDRSATMQPAGQPDTQSDVDVFTNNFQTMDKVVEVAAGGSSRGSRGLSRGSRGSRDISSSNRVALQRQQ